VSRGLGRLQAQNLIQVEGRKIVIRDAQALERELEEAEYVRTGASLTL